jgi:hypothetical protein
MGDYLHFFVILPRIVGTVEAIPGMEIFFGILNPRRQAFDPIPRPCTLPYGDCPAGLIPGLPLNKVQRSESAIRGTTVPHIHHGHFATLVQHLVNETVFTDADPVQVFCAGNFVCIVGQGFTYKIPNMLKNVRDDIPGNFPEIFFNACPECY